MKKVFLILGLFFMFLLMISSVNAFNISEATYTGENSNLNNAYNGLWIANEGKLFYSLYANGEDVYMYNLTTPYNISTRTYYTSKDFSSEISTQFPKLTLSPTGHKLYLTDTSTDRIYEYNLSTNFDISTATYTNCNVADGNLRAGKFKTDGTEIYTSAYNEINKFSLSTAWDLCTASSIGKIVTLPVASESHFITSDGYNLITAGYQNGNIYQYNVSTAWDFSTLNLVGSYTSTEQDFITDVYYNEIDRLIVNGQGSTDGAFAYEVLSGSPSNVFTVNNTQTPSNLTTGQIGVLLINTSVTDTLGELGNLNDSYASIDYDVVSIANNNCGYINLDDNSCNSLDTIENMTKLNNSEFSFSTYELNYLPAVYSFDQNWIQQQTMSEHNVKGGSFIRMNVKNMTTNQNHIINVEYNIEPYSTSGDYTLLFLYCNSSYTTGDPDPTSEPNCALIDEILPTDDFSHCHSVESCHHVSRLNKDITWTENGYFMFGTLGTSTTDSWNVNYVENASYSTQSFSLTHNGGSSWTPSNQIMDIHFHQFATNDGVNYTTTFYDGEGNSQASESTFDKFDILNAPPSTFIVNDPQINYTINSTGVDIYFSWDATTDPDGDDIEYKVGVTSNGIETLVNLSGLLNESTLNYTHSFDSATFNTGDYRAYVFAIDENGAVQPSPQTERFNVCVNDWTALLGVCSVDNNQSVTWFDANSCSIEYEKPTSTSQICNYEDSTITDEEKYINNLTIIMMIVVIAVLVFFSVFTGYGIFIFFSGLMTLILGFFVNSIINQWIVVLFFILISALQMVLSFVMNRD